MPHRASALPFATLLVVIRINRCGILYCCVLWGIAVMAIFLESLLT